MSRLGQAFDEALDANPRGSVCVDHGGATAEVEVVDSDRLGVRVRGVRVVRDHDRDPREVARDYEQGLRSLPERVTPIEVDPGLGGATLRSHPDEVRSGEFFDIEVRGNRQTEVRRFRGASGEPREPVDWTMTRDQLGRLVDELAK